MTQEESSWKKGDILKISGNREVEVLRVIEGGMGTVLICLIKEDMTPVALKTYKYKWAKEQKFVESFRWEAETWARLGFHENIVKAFGVEKIYGFIFVIAEYVPGAKDIGSSLHDWIKKRQINENTIPLILNFAWQFCRGMIHAKKSFERELKIPFVHRDIKPSNILINTDRVVKITDFGLVKAFSEVEEICGTPPYIAPEVWLKEEVDEISDIYSFGCTLYEMIKGKPAFLALSERDYKNKHLYEKPDLKGIPEDLKDIISRCLEKDREKRRKYCICFEELANEIQEIHFKRTGNKLEMSTTQLPKYFECHSKGMGLLGLGYYEEAIKYFNEAIKSLGAQGFEYGKLAYTYRGRGRAYFELQNYQQALEDCTIALNLNPKDPVNYNNRGVIHFFMKEYDKALEDYNKAKDLDPFYADVYCNMGHVLYLKGKIEEAIESLFKALKLSPTRPEYVYNNLGAIYADKKQFRKALEYIGKAIEIDPKYAEPYLTLGLIYIYEGKTENAQKELRAFIHLAPPHYDIQINQAKQLLELLDSERKSEMPFFDFVLMGKEETCRSIINALYAKGYSVMVISPGQIDTKDKAICLNGIKTVNKAIVVLGAEGMPQDKDIIEALIDVKNKGKPSILIPYTSMLSSEAILEEILKIVKLK